MLKEEFRKLYDYTQTLEPKISRRAIENKLREIFPLSPLMFHVVDIDVQLTRGFFVEAAPGRKLFPSIADKNIIAISKNQNYCWQRFVAIKEMMHLFDSPDEKIANAANFTSLLSEISQPAPGLSLAAISDFRGLWQALACVCPEKNRKDFAKRRAALEIDDYSIALTLRIPQQYIPHLLDENFNQVLEKYVL